MYDLNHDMNDKYDNWAAQCVKPLKDWYQTQINGKAINITYLLSRI